MTSWKSQSTEVVTRDSARLSSEPRQWPPVVTHPAPKPASSAPPGSLAPFVSAYIWKCPERAAAAVVTGAPPARCMRGVTPPLSSIRRSVDHGARPLDLRKASLRAASSGLPPSRRGDEPPGV